MSKEVTLKFDRKTGGFRLNSCYKEILLLFDKLDTAGIPFELRRNMDGWQICYPTFDTESETHSECVCSCIQHYGSCGGTSDRLEIVGLLTPEEAQKDCVVGWLTADDVFARIETHWKARE